MKYTPSASQLLSPQLIFMCFCWPDPLGAVDGRVLPRRLTYLGICLPSCARSPKASIHTPHCWFKSRKRMNKRQHALIGNLSKGKVQWDLKSGS